MTGWRSSALLGLLMSGWAGMAAAQEAPAVIDSGDTAWMLTATAIVLMMTIPGVALFYGGLVRKKNILSLFMQVFTICCAMTIVWMVAGYSLAFTGDGLYLGGLSRLMLGGLGPEAAWGTIPESVFVAFQMTFAIITPALIVGAIVDRMKFGAMLLFMVLWSLLVYAPIAHWVWGGGFLGHNGVLDFAGGTVVHINSGVAGLVAALVLGRRMGLGSEPMTPFNPVYTVVGAALLWVGWFGFNAGSALAANATAGMAMTVTQIAAAAAALAWMAIEWACHGKPTLVGIATGAVAGLVAITPAAGFVLPGGALAIGIAAGAVCYWAATSLKNRLGYDDSLDVFGVHGVGGIVGALLTGVFATEAAGGAPGLLEGNPAQLWIQVEGIVWTIAWCGAATFVILKLIDAVLGLRVDQEVEREGLDLALHGEVVQ